MHLGNPKIWFTWPRRLLVGAPANLHPFDRALCLISFLILWILLASLHGATLRLPRIHFEDGPPEILVLGHCLRIMCSLPFQEPLERPCPREWDSLIRLVWTPSMKWLMAIVSTSLTHLEGWYWSLSNIKNSCLDSL